MMVVKDRKVSATVRVGSEDVPIRGEYHGGAYIDLYFADYPDNAFDVINVWDYVKDEPTIPFYAEAVRKAIIEWAEAAGDSLDHDLAAAAYNTIR